MKLFCSQSNYLPWKGFLDAIGRADVYVVLDEVQYTKNDWRNRNRIKGAGGLQWLTVPVKQERLDQRIDETRVADQRWRAKHLRTISQAYARAPFKDEVLAALQPLFEADESSLSAINRSFLEVLAGQLGITTPFRTSTEFQLGNDRCDRLLELCEQLGADEYLSGPAARAYLDVTRFEQRGIEVTFLDYGGYPEYPQLHGGFEHAVSVIDLLMNVGEDAPRYLKWCR